jgi:hypothetical protein
MTMPRVAAATHSHRPLESANQPTAVTGGQSTTLGEAKGGEEEGGHSGGQQGWLQTSAAHLAALGVCLILVVNSATKKMLALESMHGRNLWLWQGKLPALPPRTGNAGLRCQRPAAGFLQKKERGHQHAPPFCFRTALVAYWRHPLPKPA